MNTKNAASFGRRRFLLRCFLLRGAGLPAGAGGRFSAMMRRHAARVHVLSSSSEFMAGSFQNPYAELA